MMRDALTRIADALERLAPDTDAAPDWTAPGYIWRTEPNRLVAVPELSGVRLDQLVGLTRNRDTLLKNTAQFAAGYPANDALLWGARGTGKSSLAKAVVREIAQEKPLILIEIAREDLATLAALLDILRDAQDRRFVLFCDDLSFDYDDGAYKSLKALLDGGIAGKPENLIFYATSNRRHLMPRDMIDNEKQAAINETEAVEEKLSLSDRFGLWLGFYSVDQDAYLSMVTRYLEDFGVDAPIEAWRPAALEWQVTRGARSGRVAWQFSRQYAGEFLARASGDTQ